MYVCIYTYTYINIYTHIYIDTDISISISMYICTHLERDKNRLAESIPDWHASCKSAIFLVKH